MRTFGKQEERLAKEETVWGNLRKVSRRFGIFRKFGVCRSHQPGEISLRDAPLDIWAGGGARVFVACKLFENLREKTFFWRSTFRRRNFLAYAFPIMYVTTWCFFWSTYFSSISTTNFFFLPTFSMWRQTIIFNFFLGSPPPPPRYQMVRPLLVNNCSHLPCQCIQSANSCHRTEPLHNHWPHDVVATLNQRLWRWFNVATTRVPSGQYTVLGRRLLP